MARHRRIIRASAPRGLSTMNGILAAVRKPDPGRPTAVIRILLGLLFLSTGLMKILVPDLRAAFSGQLTAASIPFHGLNMWVVPVAEVLVGLLLFAGLYSRLAAFAAAIMMFIATYVHLVVHDPALFPLQPEAPTIPIVALVLCAYVVWRGGGSWSADLRSS